MLSDTAADNNVVTEGIRVPSGTQNSDNETAGREAGIILQKPAIKADAGAGSDVTNLLKQDMEVTLTDPDTGNVITEIIAEKKFSLDVSFKVPTKFEGTPYVIVGDWVDFCLDKNISIEGSPLFDLMHGAEKIGTVTFMSGSEKVEIKFDGTALSDDGVHGVVQL